MEFKNVRAQLIDINSLAQLSFGEQEIIFERCSLTDLRALSQTSRAMRTIAVNVAGRRRISLNISLCARQSLRNVRLAKKWTLNIVYDHGNPPKTETEEYFAESMPAGEVKFLSSLIGLSTISLDFLYSTGVPTLCEMFYSRGLLQNSVRQDFGAQISNTLRLVDMLINEDHTGIKKTTKLMWNKVNVTLSGCHIRHEFVTALRNLMSTIPQATYPTHTSTHGVRGPLCLDIIEFTIDGSEP